MEPSTLRYPDHRAQTGAGSGPRRARNPNSIAAKYADLALVVPFLIFFYIQLAHHQLWLDELNAWAIAAGCSSVRQLLHFVHYEAHPPLWYLLLWPFTRLTAAPVAMKCVQAAIGTAVYLVLALNSPFSRAEKVLLYLSYYISFEYTVLSRMYGVLLLVTLIYAWARSTRADRILTNALLLALMANTDTMGILLSSALALEYLLDRYAAARRHKAPGKLRVVTAMGLYFGAVALSVLTLKPARDISQFNPSRIFSYAWSLPHLVYAAVCYLVVPWFPIARGWPRHFWEPVVRVSSVYGVLLPVILVLLFLLFRRERSLLLFLAVAAAVFIAFAHLIYSGFVRHFGVFFLAFLVALWLQRRRRHSVPVLSYVFLGLSALGGVQAAVAQWTHPFSNNANAAAYIREHHLANLPLIGVYETSVTGVAESLERPAYFLECNCRDTFLPYDNRRDNFQWNEIPQRLDQAMRTLGSPHAVFVTSMPLSQTMLDQLRARSLSLAVLTGYHNAEAPYDPAILYEVTRAPA